jgi:hypothetical protein
MLLFLFNLFVVKCLSVFVFCLFVVDRAKHNAESRALVVVR